MVLIDSCAHNTNILSSNFDQQQQPPQQHHEGTAPTLSIVSQFKATSPRLAHSLSFVSSLTLFRPPSLPSSLVLRLLLTLQTASTTTSTIANIANQTQALSKQTCSLTRSLSLSLSCLVLNSRMLWSIVQCDKPTRAHN